MTQQSLDRYGPLKLLIGMWEGKKGVDLAPDDDRAGVETNLYRESLVFEPIGEVNNHEQALFGLRYKKTAWRIGEADSFHEEIGYWLWDAENRQVMRSLQIPRGVTVLAGGTADAKATSLVLTATLGSPTYGICSNPFLDREFKTVRFEGRVTMSNHELAYEDQTHLVLKGRGDVFIHKDTNTLQRV